MTLIDLKNFLATLGVTSAISPDGSSLTVVVPVVTPPQPPQPPETGTGGTNGPAYLSSAIGGGPDPTSAPSVVATDYGVRGDGTTDDTAALQKAADAARAASKPLHIPMPPGGPSSFYKITSSLRIACSVIGAAGLPQIKNVVSSPSGQYGTTGAILRLVAGMTGWVKGLRLTGPYVPGVVARTEWDEAIACSDVQGVTVKGCILEGMAGDGIGDQLVAGAGALSVLVDGNTIRGNWRCGLALVNLADQWVVVNNVIDKPTMTQGNTPIDLEPWRASSKITNVEIGYNRIVQHQTGVGDQLGYQEMAPAAVKLSAYFDATPGGSIYVHHNSGAWPNSFLANIASGAPGIPSGVRFSPVVDVANVQG